MHSPIFHSFVLATVHFLTVDLFRTKVLSTGIEQTTLHLSNQSQFCIDKQQLYLVRDPRLLWLAIYGPLSCQCWHSTYKRNVNSSLTFMIRKGVVVRSSTPSSGRFACFRYTPSFSNLTHYDAQQRVPATCASWSSSFSSLNFILSCLKRWK